MTDSNCTCKTCGSQFKPVKGKRNIYCGMPCYRVAQKRGDYIGSKGTTRKHQCAHCNADVLGKSKSSRRNGALSENIFCNRICYDAFKADLKNKVLRRCAGCDNEISRAHGHGTNAKYCSNDCKLNHKKSKDRHCISCGVWFSSLKWNNTIGRLVADNFRKTCSEECYINQIKTNQERKDKISQAFQGAKHPNWQGGSSYMEANKFRGSNWQVIRQKIIKRDDFKCIQCGLTREQHYEKYGRDLSVNHIKPFHQFGGKNELANKPSNLETLCDSCHTKADWQYRKSNSIQQILCFA